MTTHADELTSAEVLLVTPASWLAAVVIVAYAWDGLGFVLSPSGILAASLLIAGVMAGWMRRHAVWRGDQTVVAAAIVLAVLAWLTWIAWPRLLPPGGGPDLTHHLLLIDYIERYWRLVHDPAVEPFLGEMAAYTPGAHLLAALGGAWTGRDGLHTVYVVVALTVALKCGFVFLIALRMIGDEHRLPLAVTAVLLLLLPQAYFIGSFTHDSFVAQVVSELFAVIMWWALAGWDQRPARFWMVMFGMAGAAVFLTWPVYSGAPMATLLALVVVQRALPLRERAISLVIGAGPVLAAAAAHLAGRMNWVGMVRVSAAVLEPSIAVYGWVFLLLSALGFLLTLIDRRRRSMVLLAFALAGQTTALLIVALRGGATTPYMALKMPYYAVYLQAVAGAIALAALWHAVRLLLASRQTSAGLTIGVREAWVVPILLACALTPGALAVRTAPVVTLDLTRAGRWARANVPRECVDYLVRNGDTAYFLHLAALGNPRMSNRTKALDAFEPNAVIGAWVAGEVGRTYAIADVTLLPNDLRDRADVLASFGSAAVLKRRGPSFCPAS